MGKILGWLMSWLISASAWAVGPFELPQMNGENVGQLYRSSDHENAIFVLEAYFNLCPYCHENAPAIKQLQAEFKDEPRVQILDIGRDCRDSDYRSWVTRHQPQHPVLKDCSQILLKQLNVTAFPTTVIVDCKGQERLRNVGTMGGQNATYAQIVAKVRALLAEKCD